VEKLVGKLVEKLMEDLETQAAQPQLRIAPELALPGVQQGIGELMLLDEILAGGGAAAMMPGRMEIR
jgi:hypothetical protein